MHTNRLANEKSPYLLQHAHNPVDWHAWGPEAFEKARAENKPIFLSIGYSTCHWCHVMERESFENEKIAALLNEHFVAIKVDREERPDVDRIYMTYVQASTGGGGWPMSVWLTPDRAPFFGGTYFPPENRYGHPGFAAILEQIAQAWRDDRERIADSARDIVRQLQQHVAVEPGAQEVSTTLLDGGYTVFRRTFDPVNGGFGGAPKFPRPSVFHFLLREYVRTKSRDALEMVLTTLRAMAKGGMHDQLGGGFHRYAVDERWFVPHFEKMLYDQAQLAIAYLEAYQIERDAEFAAVARGILDYVLRDMTDPDGGFYSAEDADSVIVPEEPDLKGEGAFYLWTADEIRALVPEPAASWFCYRYGVADGGNVASDPHGEFTGKNILYQEMTLEETAEQFDRAPEEIAAGLAEASRILLGVRSERVRPERDDKILAGWNGLMISAFALGGAVLEEPRYQEAARRAAEFVSTRLYSAETGDLLRRYRSGEAAIPAFLDDYALVAQGLLDLYEAQFDWSHLALAATLTGRQRELFEDRTHGGFFSTDARDSSLVILVKEDYDGAEPSGNSVAARNLLRLAAITGRSDFQQSAERLMAAFASRLAEAPVALPYLLSACQFLLSEPGEIVLVGAKGSPDTKALARVVHQTFSVARVVLLLDTEESREFFAGMHSQLASMSTLDGRAAAYVCRNYACQLPVSEAGRLAELIQ